MQILHARAGAADGLRLPEIPCPRRSDGERIPAGKARRICHASLQSGTLQPLR